MTPRRARISFRAQTESIPLARHFAVRTTEEWGYEALGDDVALLVSELVTNAVHHTDADGVLELTELTGGVRVEVHDASTMPPIAGRGGPDDESGRGINLVRHLASAWGVLERHDGKAVWFELVT